ncbi:hypothetical protein [Henriciella aquimarina]|uniref:hypothetical protein n=1 Tax=Henriciella aquimarina TaxID=545261 RepID=UPI0009FE18CD|nr:hypothetical protein [Henriciella aquimarina]
MRHVLWLAAIPFLVPPLAAQAQGQANDTLRHVLNRGAVITAQGFTIPMTFEEDGTYHGQAADAEFEGTWRVNDDRLCTASLMSQTETCVTYPPGRRPGDVFDVVSPTLGRMSVRINE